MRRGTWKRCIIDGKDLQFESLLPKAEHPLFLRALSEGFEEEYATRRLGHAGAVQEACFVDGTEILLSVDDLGDLSLWKVRRGTKKKNLIRNAIQARCHESRCVNCLVVNKEAAFTGGDDRCMRLWDIERSLQQVRCFEGHDSYVLDCDYSREADVVASSSIDRHVKLWNRNSPTSIGEFDSGDACWSVRFDVTDPNVLYTAGRRGVKLWDVRCLGMVVMDWDAQSAMDDTYQQDRQRKQRKLMQDKSPRMQLGHQEPWIVYPQGPSTPLKRVYSPSHGQYTENFEGHTAPPFSAKPLRNGLHILTSAYDYTHKLWSCHGEGLCTLNWGSFWDAIRMKRPRPTPKPAKPAISNDGMLVISGTEDGCIVCWNLAQVMTGSSCTENHVQVVQVHNSAVTCVCISDDDTAIAVGSSTGGLVVRG